jgi:hypothetical protein
LGAASLAVAQPRSDARDASSTSDKAGYPAQQSIDYGVYDIATAYGQAAAARAEYYRADTEFNLTVIRLQREFQTSQEYKAALADVESARDALDAARKPVLDQVAGDPKYTELMQKHDRVAGALAEGNLPAQDVVDLAGKKMEYGSVARKMESDALNKDSSVQSARQRLVSAQQKVNDLRERFEATLYQNPQWAAAKTAYENAKMQTLTSDAILTGSTISRIDTINADARRYRFGNVSTPYGDYGYGYGDPYYGRHF